MLDIQKLRSLEVAQVVRRRRERQCATQPQSPTPASITTVVTSVSNALAEDVSDIPAEDVSDIPAEDVSDIAAESDAPPSTDNIWVIVGVVVVSTIVLVVIVVLCLRHQCFNEQPETGLITGRWSKLRRVRPARCLDGLLLRVYMCVRACMPTLYMFQAHTSTKSLKIMMEMCNHYIFVRFGILWLWVLLPESFKHYILYARPIIRTWKHKHLLEDVISTSRVILNVIILLGDNESHIHFFQWSPGLYGVLHAAQCLFELITSQSPSCRLWTTM